MKLNTKIYDALSKCAAIYSDNLMMNNKAMKQVKAMGFTKDSVIEFSLGFAPDKWNFISNHPELSEIDKHELIKIGLIKKKANGKGYYDAFRNRILFPIFEELESECNCIGFTARDLSDQKDTPKYLHSTNSDVFQKNEHLFGLTEYKKQNTVIITEGAKDALKLTQLGISNVTAVLGSSLSKTHVEKLAKVGVKNVWLFFDGDEAGKRAVNKAIQSIYSVAPQIEITVILSMDGTKDPSDIADICNTTKDVAEHIIKIKGIDWVRSTINDLMPKSPQGEPEWVSAFTFHAGELTKTITDDEQREKIMNQILIRAQQFNPHQDI